MRRQASALVVVLGSAAALLFAPLSAEGQKPARSGDAGARVDPDNVRGLSDHMRTLLAGVEKYNAKDYAAAIDLFKKGIQMNPRDPLGPYLLGEGHLAAGSLADAEAAFKQAEEISDSRAPLLRSHVLFAVADCYEREKKWELARAAWQKYAEHAPKVPDGGAFPQSGAARLKAIDDVLQLDKAYEIVRQRIAAEKDGGADAAADASSKK